MKRGIGRVGMMAGILFLAGGWLMAASAADELPKESVLPATLAGKAVQAALDELLDKSEQPKPAKKR